MWGLDSVVGLTAWFSSWHVHQHLGRQIERRKNQNREKIEPLALDGRHSMERHNNQPKVGDSDGL
jgi:hypothetical protein